VVYVTAGNVAVMEAVGKNEGHSASNAVHPTGICIHTLLNFDPDGRSVLIPFGNPGSAIDSDTFNAVHSIVPGGHVVRSGPTGPRSPVSPVGPTAVLGPHNSGVWLIPFAPFGGVLPELIAKDAVSARTVEETGTLAVTASNAWPIFCIVVAPAPPKGK